MHNAGSNCIDVNGLQLSIFMSQNKMKKISCFFVATLLLFSGTAFSTQLDVNSWESKWQIFRSGGTLENYEEHWHVCGVKYRLRNYNDSFICFGLLERRTKAEFAQDGMEEMATKYYSSWLLSSMNFELGQFEKSLKFAIEGLSVFDVDLILQKTTKTSLRSFALRIGGHGVKGVSNGNSDKVDFRNNPARIDYSPDSVYYALLALARISAIKLGDIDRTENFDRRFDSVIKSNVQVNGNEALRYDLKALSAFLPSLYSQGRYKDFLDGVNLLIYSAGAQYLGKGTPNIVFGGFGSAPQEMIWSLRSIYRTKFQQLAQKTAFGQELSERENKDLININRVLFSLHNSSVTVGSKVYTIKRNQDYKTSTGGSLAAAAATVAFSPFIAVKLFENTLLPEAAAFELNYENQAFLLMWAGSLLQTGNLDLAESLLDELLSNEQLSMLGGLYWQSLYQRGLVEKNRGNNEAAIRYFKESSESIERVRTTISVEAAKIGFSGDKQAVYQDLVKALAAKGDWQGAFEYAERAKARALVDMLSQQAKLAPPPSVDEKVLALLERAETLEAPMPILEADGQTRTLAIAARKELGKVAPETASLISVSPVLVSEIAARLAPQETLVNYFNAGDELYALVMNGTTIKGYKLNAEGLEGEVRAFREGLEASDPKAEEQGRKLYARLIAPIASELKGKKVTISPHAALHYLPFGALSDGKKYLLENYSLRVMPSASTLAYVRSDKPNKAGKILALGNPDLNDPKLDLPAAQEEANQVASLFPTSKALVRKEASKAAINELGNGFSILHIASHGQFDAGSPLNSGLLLAGNGVEEGRLTVSDLYTMRLDTELVTLSACETALGKVASGDDVVGLTRGFLYAGARSIVASLWQVDDVATAKLMTAFYKNLAKKIDQREALRLAQVETKKAYPHPFYWAAFQITGAAN